MGHFGAGVDGDIKLSNWWNEAEEAIEATKVVEAVEVNEAVWVPDAREITQYAKCKLSYLVKRHKQAKNVGKKIWKYLYIMYIQTLFCIYFLHSFRTEAVEDRDVTFNQIQGS